MEAQKRGYTLYHYLTRARLTLNEGNGHRRAAAPMKVRRELGLSTMRCGEEEGARNLAAMEVLMAPGSALALIYGLYQPPPISSNISTPRPWW